MATIEGQVGPQALTNGASATARTDRSSAIVNTEAHGRYREATYQKAMFSGTITGQITTVGLATTYTGLCLTNPVGSPVNLSVNKVGFAFIVAFAAASTIALMTGFNASTAVTQTTPVTVRNQFFTGGTSGSGLLASAATLPTAPTLNTILGAGLTGAITTATVVTPAVVDLEGGLEIPPGGYVAFYTSTASGAAGGAFSFQWEEIPV
jgi:hypothetical protein